VIDSHFTTHSMYRYIPSILILLILSIPAASNELRVKNMYELFPFPPLDVKSTVYISHQAIPRYPRHFIGPSQWLDIKHHVFSGRTPTGTLTLLFAGSGTGTSTILLCNQLRQHNIKFTAVHFGMNWRRILMAHWNDMNFMLSTITRSDEYNPS
jgi:hypothetical protein